ncbi:hypothetical protein Bbelb_444180, partial [Branchiostoma belcheri]
ENRLRQEDMLLMSECCSLWKKYHNVELSQYESGNKAAGDAPISESPPGTTPAPQLYAPRATSSPDNGGGTGAAPGESAHRALILSLLMPAAAPAFCSARQSWSNIYTCERLPSGQIARQNRSAFPYNLRNHREKRSSIVAGLVPVEGKSSLGKVWSLERRQNSLPPARPRSPAGYKMEKQTHRAVSDMAPPRMRKARESTNFYSLCRGHGVKGKASRPFERAITLPTELQRFLWPSGTNQPSQQAA